MVFVAIYQRLIEIILAPINHKEMFWILAPLLASLLLMELYFDHYKGEHLDWGSAFGNCLVLIFVSLDLLRFLYNRNMLEYVTLENALVIAVLLLGIALTLMDFFHVIPRDLAFGFSSWLPVNLIACLTIIIIYAGIAIDFYTAVASVLIAIFASLFFKVISWLIPESGEIPELENIEEE